MPSDGRIVRGTAFLALLLLGGCAPAEPPPSVTIHAPERLPKAISWRGRATVHAGPETVEIGVSTRVEPFGSVRSESWLLSQGPSSSRAMIIDGSGGWIERGGKREPMPETMLRHERQQFALYGMMLQAMRRAKPSGETRLTLGGGDVPRTEFTLVDGRLREARNQVSDPGGGSAPIDQLFRFSGEIEDEGIRWPRRIEIVQRGQPYFLLEIESFEAGDL